MHETKIESLKTQAYATKLSPGKVRELGEHVQVWGVRIFGHLPTGRKVAHALPLVGVALTDGHTEIYLRPDQFPAAGKMGLKVSDFAETLWAHIPGLTQKSRVVLVAYGTAENYGPLDVHDLDARLTYYPSGGNAYGLKYLCPCGTPPNIEFVDLASFFPDADLRETAAGLGVPVGLEQPARPDPADQFTQDYVRQEARAVWGLFALLREKMRAEFGIDIAVYRTPASCAARVYVSRYLKESPAGPIGVRKYIRLQALRSYWGGRAEAFTRGHLHGDLSIYDAVSLYPSAAIALGEMPTGNSWYRLTMSSLHSCTGGVCSVEFEFPADELHPCLPVQSAGKMLYPRRGVSHCTVHEVRYALECGAHVSILSGYGYSRGDKTLAQYSRDILAQKNAADAAGDKVARTVYKLMLNSLYGKFAQCRVDYDLNTLRWACRLLGLPGLDALEGIPNWPARVGDMRAGGEGEPLEEEITVGGQWCPEWAALIQGYARYIESRAMREYVALLGTTDSILIDGDAGDDFYIGPVQFKRESRGDHAVIVRSRLYVLAQGDVIQHAALHGMPQVEHAPAALLEWKHADELKIVCERVRQLRDGLSSGMPVGRMGKKITHTVDMAWDEKRVLVGDYSEPFKMPAAENAEAAAQ